jgi:hypothetical protein
MSQQKVADELQLIRAMTVLATQVVSSAEDGIEPSRLPEARIVLRHVEDRMVELEAHLERPQLKAVRS